MFMTDYLSVVIVYLLVVLFFISFGLFIRRLLKNHEIKMEQLRRIEEKLDKILVNQEK
ncbi:DUF4083 family protein [Bacillus sp. APMAM]|uniref:DUF4083 family protein n=2 Tax=Bacillaceae TaxID=186817 RepID=UPI0009FA7A67|nr:DUF4083 family protein [Bacillus sp. APMAM]NEY97964.1 DUF4083 domain-containing protein [Heyndrickxia shackletonii]RTZ54221.1 DUF4083 domain-containing protein [Bacillus sp. SAJ1]